MRNLTAATAFAMLSISGAGCIVTQQDHEALAAKTAHLEKELLQSRADVVAMRSDLEATRQRLDNALRSNADSSSDLLTSKQRLNDLAGRVDEVNHHVDEVKRELTASRTELYARIDELKRVPTPSPAAPTITVPADKSAHGKQLEEAYGRKEWSVVRVLGPEYVNRYPNDDKADDALFYVGSADLQDGRPSSALGQFNRLLKLFPRSTMLDRTLLAMGDAYLMLHDCANAKLAYDACEKRYSKEPIGAQARGKLQQIASSPPGLCAPP